MPTFEEIQEISTDGFQVVSGEMFRNVSRLNIPSITLWNNSISFNKAAIVALNNCERIRIEVNPKTRCFLLIPVTAKDKDNVKWMKTGRTAQSKRIECKAFTSQLFKNWKWNPDYVYRAAGRIVTAETKVMLLFDFSEPESWKYNEKVKGPKNE